MTRVIRGARREAGHAAVAEAARTPIQIGENWWGPCDMAKSIAAGPPDCAMVDVTKIWGVTDAH